MKKYLGIDKKSFIFISLSFLAWRIFLFIPQLFAESFLTQRQGYIGPIPWANFDGMHYLSIADHGYYQYEEAFFPLFPIFIKLFRPLFLNDLTIASVFLVSISFFLALIVFYKLLRLDYSRDIAYWAIIFLLVFPTSFFFGAIYTESVFMLFIFLSFYFARKQNWLLASIFVGLSTATRLVGVFMLPALIIEYLLLFKKDRGRKSIKTIVMIGILSLTGIIAYMVYLWVQTRDPLLFVHVQSSFKAGRSGGEIILLPQVIYRYFKIFITVPFTHFDFILSFIEFISFVFATILLAVKWRSIRLSYLVFSFFAIILPTLSGTFSSMPRYIVVAFPIYILLAQIKNIYLKGIIIFILLLLQVFLTSYFIQGYFVS